MSEAAPWLVGLDVRSTFTRRLFTRGKVPWHIWGKAACVLLWSTDNFNEMMKWCRRYTKLRDENGKWFYFHFWEPSAVRAIFDDDRLIDLRGIYRGRAVATTSSQGNIRCWNRLSVPAHPSKATLAHHVRVTLSQHRSDELKNLLAVRLTADARNMQRWPYERTRKIIGVWFCSNIRDDASLEALTLACIVANLPPAELASQHAEIWNNSTMPYIKKARLMLRSVST